MNSNQIRESFLKFFESKQHQIIPSAPMVVKNDPTLMFTNAGMNQFKDIFLGNSPITHPRIANTQKCLRVSGKHNDLEEVGHDTYHHTMFEMLGNWSFGQYFKEEAIRWAWEFLTETLKIEKDRLYVTIFEGDESDLLERDTQSFEYWKFWIDENRILLGNKKDNFWEMGDTGPCGPCSEIHVDIRNDKERKKVDGKTLVNTGNPLVIEIWNLVFIQYNRKANGELQVLPNKHVDTGMGFERLCMVIQKKQSNYDTDVFTPIINEISRLSGKPYGKDEAINISMRVIADHLRAVSFAIADGQLPSNNKAGYVIRRILRRAIRYSFSYLDQNEPFLCKLVPAFVNHMGNAFPELKVQEKLILQVIAEEENAFLKTLSTGIKLLDQLIVQAKKGKTNRINGKSAFELYDTYGFPVDLTELILKEQAMEVDKQQFDVEMQQQKSRSRSDAVVESEDWVIINSEDSSEFVGYDYTEIEIKITRYRKVQTKGKTYYHLIFNRTPFYAESGGQVGDSGIIKSSEETISITDTKKENNLTIHVTEKLPLHPEVSFIASVDIKKRIDIENNHSATHLLHQSLRKILGTHVEQKGSLVHPDYLRFDFSHFQKLTDEEIRNVETFVNERIRRNIVLDEKREMVFDDAVKAGAMALFGEKYGSKVRVVRFADSVELCGGTHVKATGQIGFFKITSESAIAAGIRRIEAITGSRFEEYLRQQEELIAKIKNSLKNPQDIIKSIETLIGEKENNQKKLNEFTKQHVDNLCSILIKSISKIGEINFVAQKIEIDSTASMKELSFQLKNKVDNLFLVIGSEIDGKANLNVMISENLVKEKNINASVIVRDIAKEIDGGGGGQPFYATAGGGKKPEGIEKALAKAKEMIQKL
jgi:alanyl-tRNA synthetase